MIDVWKEFKKFGREQWKTLTVGALILALIPIAGSFFLHLYQRSAEKSDVVETLLANVEAMRTRHEARLANWDELMERLVTKDPKTNEDARPYLMVEAFETNQLAPLENNLERLGLLHQSLAESVLEFYALSVRLETEVRLLTGPIVFQAGRPHQVWLRDQNQATQEKWNESVDTLVLLLEGQV